MNIEQYLKERYLKEIKDASPKELEEAFAAAMISEISDNWKNTKEKNRKKAYYFSAEYLLGRMVFSNLLNTGKLCEYKNLIAQKGGDIALLEENTDIATGNGGLGRLAACFLDSAAAKNIPLCGYGIKYKDGLFRQYFEDGFQKEKADDWDADHNPWLIRKESEKVLVSMGKQRIYAVPYDMPVIGYKSKTVNTLRLWQAEAENEFDFEKFNNGDTEGALWEKNSAESITRVLYPNDNDEGGKLLRLSQQYFFTAASVYDILKNISDINNIEEKCAIQLNDTHPVVAIPEFIRLLQKRGMDFDTALEKAKKVFSYTNHTIMEEALEKWDVKLFSRLLPEIFDIIKKTDKKLASEAPKKGRRSFKIICGQKIHMARLAIYCGNKVNGVAKIHTDILKTRELSNWSGLYPDKFLNVTNGVAQRRWLALCNPELTRLISDKIGEGFISDFEKIGGIEKYARDESFINDFTEVKKQKKKQLADYILKKEGIKIDENSVFDVQIKRMHEYKRQLMNAFSILDIYYRIKEGEIKAFPKTTFIFGGKAAPGYEIAKAVIKFINEVGALIRKDEEVSKILSVVFVSDYNVSYAERLVCAADISEQISTAGTEASGTGNMKLMMNGAVTLGTMDGANVEIFGAAGKENNYIFGAKTKEILKIDDAYDPKVIYNEDKKIKRLVDSLKDGSLPCGKSGALEELFKMLMEGSPYQKPDKYKVLYDLKDYTKTRLKAIYDAADKKAFAKKCIMNIAKSGCFSSDRSVCEYAQKIWKI